VILIEEGLGASAPDSLPEVEMRMAPPPREADVASMEWADAKMAWEEPSACEVVAVAREDLAVGGEVAGAVSVEVMSEEVFAPLALTGVSDPTDGERASPSLAQKGGDMPARGGTLESRDRAAAILALSDEVEDGEWQGISGALSVALGTLGDIAVQSCQV
jgi:hypothetical protein